MEIAGKVAIVTGGAQGIGAALARALARDGAAHVHVCDLDGEGAASNSLIIPNIEGLIRCDNPS